MKSSLEDLTICANRAYNSGKGTPVERGGFWGDMKNQKTTKLSAGDQELVGLVAVGLTDDEIATQLQIPQHTVVNRIARLLAKLGAQDRVEIVLYAYSDPAMYQRINTEVIDRTTKTPQAQTRRMKQKAS